MIVFIDRTQFFLIPALGFVRDAGNICFVVTFMWFGISFKLFRIPQNN